MGMNKNIEKLQKNFKQKGLYLAKTANVNCLIPCLAHLRINLQDSKKKKKTLDDLVGKREHLRVHKSTINLI